MSMLACWFPVIREIDYFQCVVFPFVKVLHKNTIMCFETLVTYISKNFVILIHYTKCITQCPQ